MSKKIAPPGKLKLIDTITHLKLQRLSYPVNCNNDDSTDG